VYVTCDGQHQQHNLKNNKLKVAAKGRRLGLDGGHGNGNGDGARRKGCVLCKMAVCSVCSITVCSIMIETSSSSGGAHARPYKSNVIVAAASKARRETIGLPRLDYLHISMITTDHLHPYRHTTTHAHTYRMYPV